METKEMGRIVTEATIENLEDLYDVRRGRLAGDQARRVTVKDALVDTGATTLGLPTRLIRQLGLVKFYSRRLAGIHGTSEVDLYETVRLTIMDRKVNVDVMEVPDQVPVLIGQIPLEHLDFVVDPRSQRLIGNPAHGGEHMFELY